MFGLKFPQEFHDLRRTVNALGTAGGRERIVLGNPLLATQADLERVVGAILSVIPEERDKNDGVVLVGHGTHHPANVYYAGLMFQVQLHDPNVFIEHVTVRNRDCDICHNATYQGVIDDGVTNTIVVHCVC